MASEWNSRALVLLLLASFFLALGLLFGQMPSIVDSEIKRNLELATSELTRTFWSQPPVDINTYYWLFPVNNAYKFSYEGEPIQVSKVGPFHFVSRMEKRLGPLSANKYRITYNASRHFKLNDTQPGQLEAAGFDQQLTYLNVIYASLVGASTEMAHSAEDPLQQRLILSGAQRLTDKFNESLFLNLTARQILLGRPVPMLVAAAKLAQGTDMHSVPIPLGPDNQFGLVSVQNNSWTGPYEIYTGYQASQGSLGNLISFQGRKRLQQFTGRCAHMQTSAGELRPMPIGDNQVLDMFQPQLCRIVRMLPTGSSRLPNGQTVSYRLAAPDFSSAATNPDNACFCLNKTLDNYCSLDGVIEIGPCNYYAPILINFNGIQLDQRITANIANWSPELFRSDPEPLPTVEPDKQFLVLKRVGVPFHVDLTITVFLKVRRDERFRHTRTVPEVSYIPLAMMRELVTIPPGLNQIFVHMESFLMLSEHLKVVFHLSSVALVCWLTIHFYSGHRLEPAEHRQQQQPVSSSLHRSVRRAPADGPEPGAEWAGGPAGVRQPPPALIFSQVDKLRTANLQRRSSRVADLHPQTPDHQDTQERPPAARQRPGSVRANGAPTQSRKQERQEQQQEQEEALDGDEEGARPSSGAKLAASTVLIDLSDPKQRWAPLNGESKVSQPEGITRQPNGQAAIKQHGSKVKGVIWRKNWVVKIYSNLLNMLGDIRQTINDAGQLDVSSNSHEDKNIKMLADRIDNWQRLSPATLPGSANARAADELPAPAVSQEPPEGATKQQQRKPAAPSERADTETEAVPAEEPSGAESIESDETIINSCSGKPGALGRPNSDARLEREPPDEGPPNDQDKARALKQMELALEFECCSSVSSSPEPTPAVATPTPTGATHTTAPQHSTPPASTTGSGQRLAEPGQLKAAPISVAVTVAADKSLQ